MARKADRDRSGQAAVNARKDELSEALETVKRLRTEAEAKVAELDRALERVRGLVGGAAAESSSQQADADPSGVSEGLRIMVIQMSASGTSREEIAERLQDEFSVVDGHSVVAAVLDRR